MMVLYIWDVDVYEDEPLRVMVFTTAWGIVAGIIVGLRDPLSFRPGVGILGAARRRRGSSGRRASFVPWLAALAMLAGPLILLPPIASFNGNVLDGATFRGDRGRCVHGGAGAEPGPRRFFTNGLQPPGRQPALDRATPFAGDCDAP